MFSLQLFLFYCMLYKLYIMIKFILQKVLMLTRLGYIKTVLFATIATFLDTFNNLFAIFGNFCDHVQMMSFDIKNKSILNIHAVSFL